tara:strand:- start:647 stop:1471 length:825 start_codon:yes stop_codon:yes gene_type:complete
MNKPTALEKKILPLLNLFENTPPALALDFDGVISELKSDPRTAYVDEYCLKTIIKLTKILPNISIISGRSAIDINSKLKLENLTYIGNHGAELIKNGQLIQKSPEGIEIIIKSALDYIKTQTKNIHGIFHENKTISASIHYRGSKNHKKTKEILSNALPNTPNIAKLDVFWGKQILEIRPHSQFNKGYAINHLIESKNIKNIIFLGDDTTDLDAMIEIRKQRDLGNISGFSIYVTQKNTNPDKKLSKYSDCSIENIEEVRKTLDLIYSKYKSSA